MRSRELKSVLEALFATALGVGAERVEVELLAGGDAYLVVRRVDAAAGLRVEHARAEADPIGYAGELGTKLGELPKLEQREEPWQPASEEAA